MIGVHKRKSYCSATNITNSNDSSQMGPVVQTSSATKSSTRKRPKDSHKDHQKLTNNLSGSNKVQAECKATKRKTTLTNKSFNTGQNGNGNLRHYQLQKAQVVGSDVANSKNLLDQQQGSKNGQQDNSSKEPVWIFGLINNIEQLLSTFNANSMIPQQQSCNHKTASSGSSTPSSQTSSNSFSNPTTPANSPQASGNSSNSSSSISVHSQQQQHSNQQQLGSGASMPSRNLPISRQIKFHEYKGPPSARRQQNAPNHSQTQTHSHSQTKVQPESQQQANQHQSKGENLNSRQISFETSTICNGNNNNTSSAQQPRLGSIVARPICYQEMPLAQQQYQALTCGGQSVLVVGNVKPTHNNSIISNQMNSIQTSYQPACNRAIHHNDANANTNTNANANANAHHFSANQFLPTISNNSNNNMTSFQIQTVPVNNNTVNYVEHKILASQQNSLTAADLAQPCNLQAFGVTQQHGSQGLMLSCHNHIEKSNLQLNDSSTYHSNVSISQPQLQYVNNYRSISCQVTKDDPKSTPEFNDLIEQHHQQQQQQQNTTFSYSITSAPFNHDGQITPSAYLTTETIDMINGTNNSLCEINNDTNSPESTTTSNGSDLMVGPDDIEPTIGFSNGFDELMFSEFIDLQDIPVNVDESDWLKKFLPPCSMG